MSSELERKIQAAMTQKWAEPPRLAERAAEMRERLQKSPKITPLGTAREPRDDPECTFRPKISRRARSASPSRPVHERLYAVKRVEQPVEEVKAKPKRNGRVYERGVERQREKEARMNAMRQAREALAVADATFSPRLVASQQTPSTPVWERLVQKKKKKPEEPQEPVPSPKASNGAHLRLYATAKEQELKRRERRERRSLDELSECSFQPRLNKSKEPSERSWSRLLAEKDKLDELKRARELEGCTFAPRLNKRSSSPSRLTEDQRAKHAERGRLRAERELEGCTFKPRTGRSPTTQSNKKVFDRMADDASRRRARSVERQPEQRRRSKDDTSSASSLAMPPPPPAVHRSRTFGRNKKPPPPPQESLDDFERWQAEMEAKLAAL